MKRLVFCFDGSWNRLDTPNPTNVLLTAESVLPIDIARPGDTLGSIAGRAYGNPAKSGVILRANANKLAGPNDLHTGQALRLPGASELSGP